MEATEKRRNLVKAGALIIAEIERIDIHQWLDGRRVSRVPIHLPATEQRARAVRNKIMTRRSHTIADENDLINHLAAAVNDRIRPY